VQHDRARLLHMQDATRQALEFAADRSRSDLDTDAMLMLALTRLLEIIGEAAKNVSGPTRALAPAIPGREIAGTRDRIAHGYSTSTWIPSGISSPSISRSCSVSWNT
jgi:uncharacterized protein with HEPN domain